MKNLKNLLPLFALLLGVTLVFTQSAFTSKSSASPKEDLKYWYQVSNGFTVGSHIDRKVKSEMLQSTDCQDDLNQDVCLFGSDTTVPNNTNIGSPTDENRILDTAQP